MACPVWAWEVCLEWVTCLRLLLLRFRAVPRNMKITRLASNRSRELLLLSRLEISKVLPLNSRLLLTAFVYPISRKRPLSFS